MAQTSRIACTLAVILLGAARVAADPMPMSAGDHPAPSTSADIALVREDLVIDVGRKHAQVVARITLENRGPATRLDVGFPCDSGADPGLAGLDCATRIVVKIDGKTAAVKRRGGGKAKHWSWPMRFAAGQTVQLDVSYRSPLRNDRYDTPFFGMGTLYYRLATGARWAGPIGELTMRVDLPTDALIHIVPPGYTRSHGRPDWETLTELDAASFPAGVEWKLTGVEPATDVAILIDPRFHGRAARAIKAVTRAEMVAAIAAGRVDAAQLREVAAEMKSELSAVLEYAKFFQEVARGKLGLPAPTDAEVRACVEESLRLMEAAAAAAR